jgi:flavin reductase (DIM6/NTAB) family NADH-FMN oxidoreductase RutF
MTSELTALYDELMKAVPSGVQVLLLRDGSGAPRGMTVSSLTPVSADPPTVLVCVGGEASMAPELKEGTEVCLSYLGPEQSTASMGFAFGEDDPFEVFAWSDGPEGVPMLDEAPAHLRGVVERVVEHSGTLVTLIRLTGGAVDRIESLVYWQRSYFRGLIPVEPATSGKW